MSLQSTYRSFLREVVKASISPRSTRNQALSAHFRSLFDQARCEQSPGPFVNDLQNAILFMRSQRTHKELLERYNPLIDLTAEERIEATARRVGFDMPVEHRDK